MKVNGKQLVWKTLQHKPMETIPYQIGFTPEAHRKMAEYFHDEAFLSALGNAMEFFDPRPPKWAPRENYIQDEFGVVFNRTMDKEVGVVETYPVNEQNVNTCAFPDIESAG
jgi:hypothetical protein